MPSTLALGSLARPMAISATSSTVDAAHPDELLLAGVFAQKVR